MYEIKVSGLGCGSCINSITSALTSVDPNADVRIDLKTQIVQVKSTKEQSEIISLIMDAGYPVISAKKVE